MDTGKFWGILALGQQLADGMVLRRFLAGLVIIITLTMIVGMMLGALLLGSFYGAYLFLLDRGLEPTAAIAVIISLALLLMMLLVLLTLNYLRRMTDVPKFVQRIEDSVGMKILPIFEAFIDGLLTRPSLPKQNLSQDNPK